MKTVNIADGQNRANQQAMHRWFWRSVVLLGTLCISMVILSVQQRLEYHELSQEYAVLKSGTTQLHACLERKRQLKEQSEKLQAQLTKANRIKHRPKNPAGVIEMLAGLPVDVVAQDITLNKKQLDLVLFAQETKAVLAYADRLRAHELSARVDVLAVEQAGNRVKALLHVVLN